MMEVKLACGSECTFQGTRHLLNHATAMPRQSVVGVVDVPHILGTPQPLSHSAGTRPSQERKNKMLIRLELIGGWLHYFYITRALVWHWWNPHTPPRGRPLHQSQASSVHQCLCYNVLSSDPAAKPNPGIFWNFLVATFPPYSTGLHICAQAWQTFQTCLRQYQQCWLNSIRCQKWG